MSKQDYAFILTKKLFDEAKAAGANCVVVACPMCHMLLDGQQTTIERRIILLSICLSFILPSLSGWLWE